jgi:hypothetical protein
MDANEATQILANEAERLGAEPNDEQGIVRALVTTHGLSFNAWFCVCCELADRNARKQGFKGQADRAARLMARQAKVRRSTAKRSSPRGDG